jgi:acyl dehydratase
MEPVYAFSVGDVVRSPSKTLTDAHFLFFAGLTGDNHPIHYDVEYAKSKKFGRPLAHGLLLAAMTAAGASPLSPQMDGFVFVEQSTRFVRPVFIGDTITPSLTVEKIWSEGHRHFVRFATAIHNQGGEKVLEGFHLYRVRQEPA